MDKKEVKDHLNKQIRSCEDVILKNMGVIEHCRYLLTIIENKKEQKKEKPVNVKGLNQL